jgi:hypothetical protein
MHICARISKPFSSRPPPLMQVSFPPPPPNAEPNLSLTIRAKNFSPKHCQWFLILLYFPKCAKANPPGDIIARMLTSFFLRSIAPTPLIFDISKYSMLWFRIRLQCTEGNFLIEYLCKFENKCKNLVVQSIRMFNVPCIDTGRLLKLVSMAMFSCKLR